MMSMIMMVSKYQSLRIFKAVMEYYQYQEDEDLIPTCPNRRIIIASLATMEYYQYQEDLIPTSQKEG